MSLKKSCVALLVAAASCITSCNPSFIKPQLDAPAPAPVINLADRNPKVMGLASLIMEIPAGTSVGELSGGIYGRCDRSRPLTVASPGSKVELPPFREAFEHVMADAGVPVEETVSRFDGQELRKADLQLSASIKEMTLNLCFGELDVSKTRAKGQASMKIEWSVFSPLERKVLMTFNTTGKSPDEVKTEIGEDGVTSVAFRSALINLMAVPEFTDLIVNGSKSAANRGSAGVTATSFKQPPAATGQIAANLNSIRKGIVTVFGNLGEGTGFAIGNGRQIVTAAHVVSGGRFVKLTTSAGDNYYGEVIQKDLRRDLALVKIEQGTLQPMHVRLEEPAQGEEVYAIGSPFGQQLEFSLTRGVLSGTRIFEGQKYLQSDVTVAPGSSGGPLMDMHGNVIGVTAGGISISGAPVGLNFFIPGTDIGAALEIKFQP
jgi:serine protease Do